MSGSVRLEVKGFKSLTSVGIDIAPVTVFIGPPASGKSNVLEALEVLGYFLRVGIEVWSGVWDSIDRVGSLAEYVRLTSCSDLMTRYSVAEEAVISVTSDKYKVTVNMTCLSPTELKAEIKVEGESKLGYRVKAVLARETVRATLTKLASAGGKEIEALAFLASMIEGLAKMAEAGKPSAKVEEAHAYGDVLVVPSPRLYSFDRMAVFQVIRGIPGDRYPLYLEEHGRNLGWLLYTNNRIFEEVREIVRSLSDLELRVLSDGRLVFFDGLRDVSTSTVSETVLRIVYTLVGLATAKRLKRGIELPDETEAGGVSVVGMERIKEVQLEPVVALEEPEAHVYPIAYNYLVDAIKQASKRALVLVATHSWNLAQLLWEKTGATIYYTVRTEEGTRVYRVDMEKAVEEDVDLEELVYAGTARADELVGRGVLVAV